MEKPPIYQTGKSI
ncbi:MAG TPA: hypothetical protein DIV79_08875 [Opitutae bacterium]|nr:hypothetical protein [Opitutae bacterium]